MGGKNAGQARAHEASIGQDGVDDVPLDLETLVSRHDLVERVEASAALTGAPNAGGVAVVGADSSLQVHHVSGEALLAVA